MRKAKIYIKCDFFDWSISCGVREAILFTFGFSKTPSIKSLISHKQYNEKKKKTEMKSILFYMEDQQKTTLTLMVHA